MNGGRTDEIDVVVAELAGARFVSPARAILSFHVIAPRDGGAEQPGSGAGTEAARTRFEDLDARLELAARPDPRGSSMPRRGLLVEAGDRLVEFQTGAALRFECLRRQAFWRLPRLLRQAGCEPWVQGIATLDEEVAGQAPALAVWIDLGLLAARLTGEGPRPEATLPVATP